MGERVEVECGKRSTERESRCVLLNSSVSKQTSVAAVGIGRTVIDDGALIGLNTSEGSSRCGCGDCQMLRLVKEAGGATLTCGNDWQNTRLSCG